MEKYHYTECGLDNVYLDGLTTTVDDHGEEVIKIPHIKMLHKAIAAGIVSHHGAMSHKELRFLRSELRMTQAALAKKVSKDAQTIGRWERNEIQIEANAERVIRLLVIERLNLTDIPSTESIVDAVEEAASTRDLIVDAHDTQNYHIAA